MICPRCQTLQSDDAAVCDNCDAILDTAFLGDDITNEAPSAENRTRVKTTEREPAKPTAGTFQRKVIEADVPDDDEEEELKAPRRSALTRIAAPPASVTEAAYDLRETFNSFPFGERMAAGGAIVFLISLGLPWRWTQAEDSPLGLPWQWTDLGEGTIGLFAGAWFLGLFAAIVCVAAFIRRRAVLRPYLEWVYTGFLSSAAVTLAGTVIFLMHSFDKISQSPGGKIMPTEWKMLPGLGLYVGIVAAAATFLGAVLAYRDRRNVPG